MRRFSQSILCRLSHKTRNSTGAVSRERFNLALPPENWTGGNGSFVG